MTEKITYIDLKDAPAEWRELLRIWRNNPRVRCEMVSQNEISPEEHSRWLGKILSPDSNDKIRIAVSEDGTPIGIIRLHDIDRISCSSDWGMYIGEEKFLGRGFGKKMLMDLIEWAFKEEKLQELHTMVHKKNGQAKTMYEAVGFAVTGESGEFYEMSRRR